jgi:hypothetical protein
MLEHGKVVGRKRDSHSNPILDTTVVVVKYDDGYVDMLVANVFTDHICAQVHEEDNQFALLKQITLVTRRMFIHHKKNGKAVHADEQMKS